LKSFQTLPDFLIRIQNRLILVVITDFITNLHRFQIPAVASFPSLQQRNEIMGTPGQCVKTFDQKINAKALRHRAFAKQFL
jgi:hypothetical protein